MKFFKYTVGSMGTNAYLAIDEESREAALVDPGYDAQRLLNAISSKGASLKYIILTHAHFDHIMALCEIKTATGADILLHRDDAPLLADNSLNLLKRFTRKDIVFPKADRLLSDQDSIYLGNSVLKVLHTPGHTPGSVCLFDSDTVISGDTVFRENIGRYDFPCGNYETLMFSLKRFIEYCGNVNFKILPGHGPSTHLSHELEHNLYLN